MFVKVSVTSGISPRFQDSSSSSVKLRSFEIESHAARHSWLMVYSGISGSSCFCICSVFLFSDVTFGLFSRSFLSFDIPRSTAVAADSILSAIYNLACKTKLGDKLFKQPAKR